MSQFVLVVNPLFFALRSIVSHKTLRVLYEIRMRWTDKVSPEERDDRVGLWEIEQVAHRDRLDQAAAKGNRIFGYETHWIEKRQA